MPGGFILGLRSCAVAPGNDEWGGRTDHSGHPCLRVCAIGGGHPILTNRFKLAAKGLVFTLAAPASVAFVQFAFAPKIVRAIRLSFGPSEDAMAIGVLHRTIVEFHLGVGLLLLVYWVVAAAFCRGDFLRIKLANACLAALAFLYVTSMVLGSNYPQPAVVFAPLCPLLGISSSDAPYGFDTISTCEHFSRIWSERLFFWVPLALLLASAVLRIAISRYRSAKTVPARG